MRASLIQLLGAVPRVGFPTLSLFFASTLFALTDGFCAEGDQPPSSASASASSPPPQAEDLIKKAKEEGKSFFQIKGTLKEAGTRKPLDNVNVYLFPYRIKAVTDKEGKFRFKEVPEGKANWVVSYQGYEKFKEEIRIDSETAQEDIELYLQKVSYFGFETTIVDKNIKKDTARKTLKAEEFLTVPGAQGDPAKAIQNLPGINRNGAFDSRVIIQGSAPEDTKYHIDGHEVPIVFHFGGLSSVMIPESVSRVDYLSAGYGPTFGRAIGGIIGLFSKKPRDDRYRGFFFVDTANAGGMIEGGVGKKSSWLFGVRQSYIGHVLRLVLKDQEGFDLTVAPSWRDLTGIYNQKISDRADFKFTTIGSQDKLEFLLKTPVESDPALRGTFFSRQEFFRLIPQLELTHEQKIKSRYSLGLGMDWIHFNLGSSFFYLKNHSISSRAEIEKVFSRNWKSYLGVDNKFDYFIIQLELPSFYSNGGVRDPIVASNPRGVELEGTEQNYGLYWRNEVRLPGSRWELLPSFRVDYFSPTQELLPTPRVAANYNFSPFFSYYTRGGIFYQPAEGQNYNEEFGNPDIKSPRAYHLATGFNRDFREGSDQGIELNSGLFGRYFDKQILTSAAYVSRNGELVPENYNNDGLGYAIGWETLFKFKLNPFSGWISYTLSRSTRWNRGEAPAVYQYDQTHNVTTVLSVDLTATLKISTRFRYVTGNPYTPIIGGVYDADNDTFKPIRGPVYSKRNDAFMQLDIRIDKKFVFDTWILEAYLDIQNATNRQNTEGVRYQYDYEAETNVTGLPIFPIIGAKAVF